MSDTPNGPSTSAAALPSGPGPVSLALFLGSAVVLFGAILAGYALLRFNDPGAFAWAPKLLDRRLGLAGAAALLVACAAAAGSAKLALAGKMGVARALLGVALAAGTAALVVRAAEFPANALRAGFLPRAGATSATPPKGGAAGAPAQATSVAPADPVHGKSVFMKTCAACHAPDGSGVKGQGANLRESAFVKGKTDQQLLAFVKVGRQPFDPETKLHLSMPARGGNPALTDQDLFDAIAQVREIQKAAAALASAPAAGGSTAVKAPAPAAPSPAASADQPQVIDGELWLPHSILPVASVGPAGSRQLSIELQKEGAASRTLSNLQRFFTIVLFLDGLHAIYLVFGLLLGVWMIWSAARAPAARTTFALVAVYWVVIGGIGLALVPALYV